ncbi:MAG: protein kinase, partial [Betaproteobacteria bacterium]|nr:protein kinase [Betaproteobacteria bacterium]
MATILIVEDEPDTRSLLRLHLESASHTVVTANNGAEGLQLALSKSPDLVLSDVRMPVMDGFELLKALRARAETVAIPLIFLTVAQDRVSVRAGMQLGADDYLDKPVRRGDLLDSIAARLNRMAQLRSALARTQTARSEGDETASIPINVEGYRIIRKLGAGGMSKVYLAQHLASGTERVLKVVPITESDDGSTVQRFIHEFALISGVHHPNVAQIFDQGFTEEYAYIAMEYFPGGDLRAMASKGMTPELALAVLMQVAGGLGAIHEQGIVHRDMKPDNVMIRADGTLAIADFGIAKMSTAQLSQTQHGEIFGTPYYISPEQATAGAVDARTDLYSLGVMYYEMLTGAKPYLAQDIDGLLYMHQHAPIPKLPAALSGYQPLVERMMAKNPAQRYASADDLVAACI